MMWEFIFLMVVLKIPIIYLCLVVYWAVKGNDRPAEPAPVTVPRDDHPWRPRSPRRRPRNGPHGSPTRKYARVRRRTAAPA